MKAILVVDIPTDYKEQLNNLVVMYGFNSYGDRICQVEDYLSGEIISFDYKTEKRLKILPKKYIKIAQISNGKVINTEDMQFMAGYNKCLDEILGEEE